MSFGDVPVPEPDDDHRYAVMGPAGDRPTATIYGSWKCPYTRAFVVNQLDGLVDAYVRPGDVALQFRTIAWRSGEPFLGPDAPRAGEAGLGVWDAEPTSFWSYFATVFESQPPERDAWATTATLLQFATVAGVERVDDLESAISTGAHVPSLRATLEAAADDDVFGVPRVVFDGTTTAPTVDPESTQELLDRAASR